MSSDLQVRPASTVAKREPIPDEVLQRFPALDPETQEELREVLDENLDDDERMRVSDLNILTVPSGKSPAVWGYDKDGKEETTADLHAVIVAWTDGRNYWVKSMEDSDGNEAPDCTSGDGVYGIGMYGRGSVENPTGLCGDCRMGQWKEEDGGANTPPPCKPHNRLMLMVEGEAFPWLLNVPRTSIAAFKKYRRSLVKDRKSVAQVLTSLTLKKVDGKKAKYYEIVFSRVPGAEGDLGKSAKVAALEWAELMKPIFEQRPREQSAPADGTVVEGEVSTPGAATEASAAEPGAVDFGDDEEYDGS